VKLAVKYALTILSLVLCIVLAFAGVILFQFRFEIARLNATSADTLRQSVLKQMQEKEATSVRVLASALTNPLYQLDMLNIKELVSATSKQPDVLYVYVYDDKRRILHDGTPELKSYNKVLDDPLTLESMRSVRLLSKVDGDTIHFAGPIRIQNEVLGGVKIGYSIKNIFLDIAKQEADLARNYQLVATRQLYTIGILALAFSIGGMIVAVLVARSWSSPIALLSNLTSRVGEGDYEILIPVNRSDEIGKLAGSFRNMVANLKELRQRDLEYSETLRATNIKLSETNDDLVKEVAVRQQAEDEVLRQNTEMRLLHEINSAVNSTLDGHVLLDTFLVKVKQLLPYAATSVRLINKVTGRLEPVAEQNFDLEIKGQVPNTGLSYQVFEQKVPIIVKDLPTDPRALSPAVFQRLGLVSYAGIPLIAEGEALGVLGFYTKKEHQFRDKEIKLLLTLAAEVATAIRKSQLYSQLQLQTEKLEKANKTKDEFLSVMSHELRTPLNVIMGYAQVLSSGIMGDITPEQEKSLKKLMLHADDLLNMINNVLQAGRLQSGLVEVDIQSVNLNDFLDEMNAAYEFRTKQAVGLIWQSPPNLISVETDRSKLKHIIQNLVNNAIKFTEEGSVTVAVRSINGVVDFEIRDTGIGIPDDSLVSIFEMFRQADSSKTRGYGGTGVGLYIVKKFTEALNGQIHVESIVGKGTKFTVTLPLESGPARHDPSTQESIVALTPAGATYNPPRLTA
jgi:signal transduction histidine kinase/HAMP domain-containing protein